MAVKKRSLQEQRDLWERWEANNPDYGQGLIEQKGPPWMKTCVWGHEFIAERKNARFCSERCRRLRDHTRECAAPDCFVRFWPRAPHHYYCSQKCSLRGWRSGRRVLQKHRAEKALRYAGVKRKTHSKGRIRRPIGV